MRLHMMHNILLLVLATVASTFAARSDTAACKGPSVHVFEHDKNNCRNDGDKPYYTYHVKYETNPGNDGYPYESSCRNIDNRLSVARSFAYTSGGADNSRCKLHVYRRRDCEGNEERYPLSGNGGVSDCKRKDWRSAKVKCTR